MVPNLAAFDTLLLVGSNPADVADSAAKQAAWDAIQAMVPDQRQRTDPNNKFAAKHYETATSVRLPVAEATKLLGIDLNAAVVELKKKFPHYDGYPAPGQAGLIDMIFNMGATRFTDSLWPNLFAAMNADDAIPDWNGVAAQCKRHAPNSDRNKEIKELFLAAAQQQPKKP